MSEYRIQTRYPVYPGNGCITFVGFFVQVFVPGLFKGKWVDIKGFADQKQAEELLKHLKDIK
jgi:hypothetical protein